MTIVRQEQDQDSSPSTRRPRRRLQTLDSWRAYRNFRFLWVANFFANTAQWLQLLSVGWLVRDLTDSFASSGLLVVAVGGMTTLPTLIVGPWAGVLGDRVNRRKLVMAVQSFMTVAAITFAFVVHSGHIEWWHAYIYVFVSGICWSISITMRQTLVANTVPREALVNAYASNTLTITGTRMIGPFIGGVLITTIGFTWNFAIEASLYAATVLAFWPMKTPFLQHRPADSNASPLSDFLEGLRYVRKQERVIWNLLVVGLIPNVLLHPVWFVLPVFTVEVLHRTADTGGVLLAVTGFGGLLSALTIASVGFGANRGLICLWAVLVSSAAVVLFAYSPWLVPAAILIGLMSLAQATFRTSSSTLIQSMVPDHLRSRITSLHLYSQGFVFMSSLAVGLLVDLTTVVVALAAVGIAGLVLGSISYLVLPKVRQAR
ncbi:MAG TPA: MFS transporter [Dehalococcoidia bacterium]|nr:MFS transporter [Dehalococcoidia bacterium]